MFPLNPESSLNLRQPEKYIVNFSRTENYRNSAILFCQRILNENNKQGEERRKDRKEQARRHHDQEREGALVRRRGA